MWRPVPVRRKNKDPSDTRERLNLLAILSYEVKQPERLFDYMKRLVRILAPNNALTIGERCYFNIACRLVHERLYNFWLHVQNAAANQRDLQQYKLFSDCQKAVAREIIQLCCDIVKIIDSEIMPTGSGLTAAASSVESRVFYLTLKGDYLRKQAMMMTIAERQGVVDAAWDVYKVAKKDAKSLPVTSVTRLELILSRAIFKADVGGLYSDAVRSAKKAIELVTKVFESEGLAVPEGTAAMLRVLQGHVDRWKVQVIM